MVIKIDEWKNKIEKILREIAVEKKIDPELLQDVNLVAETPPDPLLGDIAFPLFPFAKIFKEAPPRIAEEVRACLSGSEDTVTAAGPYLNIKLERSSFFRRVITTVVAAGTAYGASDLLAGKRIMLEFSCPNTNKPLHLGHLRNDSLGESVAKIIRKCGAQVLKVNLINDRGIHIAKSMLAYRRFGDGRTPEETGKKSDHFVGDYYVKFAEWSKQEPAAEDEARALLKAWEDGDPETRILWKTMNKWAIDGIKTTYQSTGVTFDRYYFESETYARGREEVQKGLANGIFFKKEDGSVWVDLTGFKLDEKVLLRNDGTSLYLTQDIGTAIMRAADWPFDRLVYVVASEQDYHFKVLIIVLKMLGFAWADQLFHLSYGMVNLPEGKMKSREGTVVDADDLLEELTTAAREEMREREREGEPGDEAETAKKIALGALNYYLLAASPRKDIIFDPRESISFNGNTGPYLQYTGARISSILRKFRERADRYAQGRVRFELLTVQDEWELVKRFADFPRIVARAAAEFDPSHVSGFLFDTAKIFARYYHDNQVLRNENQDLVVTRVELVKSLLVVLQSGCELVGVPFLESM